MAGLLTASRRLQRAIGLQRLHDPRGLQVLALLQRRDARLLVGDLLRRELEHERRLLALDDRDAVGIADHEVARVHGHAADRDRVVDASRHVLGGAVRVGADRVDGIAHLHDLLAVAHRGVDHDAGDAELHAGVHHDRAHQRAGGVALAVDDEDVARLRDLHRGVDHQVVAGAAPPR
jgi:hypothetical protein